MRKVVQNLKLLKKDGEQVWWCAKSTKTVWYQKRLTQLLDLN